MSQTFETMGEMPSFRQLVRERLASTQVRLCECHPETLGDAYDEAWRHNERLKYVAEIEARRKGPTVDVPWKLACIGVPPKLLERLKKRPDSWPAMQAAREWVAQVGSDSRRPFLLLLGEPGGGKSVAAAWAMGSAAARFPWNGRPTGSSPEPFSWVPTPELETLGRFADAEEWLRKVCGGHFVVLDDMGTEAQSDGPYGTLSLVERILGQREAMGRLTVLTSNLDAEKFKQRYGDRIARRVRESGFVRNCRKGSP